MLSTVHVFFALYDWKHSTTPIKSDNNGLVNVNVVLVHSHLTCVPPLTVSMLARAGSRDSIIFSFV